MASSRFLPILLLILFIFPLSSLLPAQAAESDIETTDPTISWSYPGYEVSRFTSPFDGVAPQQMYGTEAFRDAGFLPLSNTTNYRLAYLAKNGSELVMTPYTVSKMDTTWGCSTSQCHTVAPIVYSVEGKALVSHEGDWYVYDLAKQTKELWFDAQSTGLSTSVSYQAFVANDQVYVYYTYADASTRSNVPVIYWISKKNTAERIYEIPAGFTKGYGAYTIQPAGVSSIALSQTTGMLVTDHVGDNEAQVGQIGNGVYLEKNKTYMRIGYTATEPTTYAGILPFSKTSPLSFHQAIAWIGTDNAIYVATVDTNHIVSSGIKDVPRYVPFREQSLSTVFQENGNSYTDTQLTAYKSAQEYIDAHDDPTFSKVIWINDGIISATQKENAN